MSDGETIEEAITNGLDAIRGWINAMRAEGHPIPAPTRHEPLAGGALGRGLRPNSVFVAGTGRRSVGFVWQFLG